MNTRVYTIKFESGTTVCVIAGSDVGSVFDWKRTAYPGEEIKSVSYKYLAADLTKEATHHE